MNERQKRIIALVNRKGTVSFQELKATFRNVSEMTIRRDLETLDEQHALVRIHGGAKSFETLMQHDDLFQRRAISHIEAKEAIAKKALPLIKPDMAFYLDSGSTLTTLAKLLPDEHYLIFTGSLSVAMELTRLRKAEVTILGGKLNARSYCMSGEAGIRAMAQVNLAMAFFGTTGYSRQGGFTCGEEREYELKRSIALRCPYNVVLMDESKIGTLSTYTFATLDDIAAVVSDTLPDEVRQQFADHAVTVIT